MARCVHCGKTLPNNAEVCPVCGAEQPLQWVVTVMYLLVFLFVQGVIYRLIWQNVNSFSHYLVYFFVTLTIAVAGYLAWKRYRQAFIADADKHDKES